MKPINLRFGPFFKKNKRTDELLELQPIYNGKLENELSVFKYDLEVFVKEYEVIGPMEHGIPPEEASLRVKQFEVCFLFYQMNTSAL